MKRRRRAVANVFGVAFLDLICCGFGAVVILFILINERAEEQLFEASRTLADADGQLAAERAGAVAEQTYDAFLEATAASFAPAVLADPAWSAIRSAVIVLDVSGSMSLYLPDVQDFAASPAWQREAGVKWQDTVWTVAELLAALPGLERFSVRSLSDRREGRVPGAMLWPRDGGDAFDSPTIDALRGAMAALGGLAPAGGSNHHAALAAIYDDPNVRREPPDAIFLIMDGLPNHGPTGRDAPADRADDPDYLTDPSYGLISAESRRWRAAQVLELVEARSDAFRRSGQRPPAIHCLLIPWPDDPGLVEFGLSLAGTTGGRVVALSPFELRRGTRVSTRR